MWYLKFYKNRTHKGPEESDGLGKDEVIISQKMPFKEPNHMTGAEFTPSSN